jgi:hypothetical protein
MWARTEASHIPHILPIDEDVGHEAIVDVLALCTFERSLL